MNKFYTYSDKCNFIDASWSIYDLNRSLLFPSNSSLFQISYTCTLVFPFKYTSILVVVQNEHVMCLSVGTPQIMNFPCIRNGKFVLFRRHKIWAQPNIKVLNIESPENH